MRRAAISLATSQGRYAQGLQRLADSLRRSGFTGEFIGWPPGQFPAGCPPHLDVPFAFKPYCFAEARQRGLEAVLWLDSSSVAVRSLEPLFKQIEERGYFLFKNGRFRVGEWASDLALERLGVSREEALSLPEVNAAVIGLNLKHPLGSAFLDQWHAEAKVGLAFRGVAEGPLTLADYRNVKRNREGRVSAHPRVRGHRHDQTVAGVLAWRLGLELAPRGLQRYEPEHWHIGPETLIVIDRSVARRRSWVAPAGWILADDVKSRLRRLANRVRSVRLWSKT